MDDFQEKQARRLVQWMEKGGPNCGLLPVQGMVLLRSAPTDTPTTFTEGDLRNAMELNLLKKKTLKTVEWEWYVKKPTSTLPKAGQWIVFANGARKKIGWVEQGTAFYGNGSGDLVPFINLVPDPNGEKDVWQVDSNR